VAFGYDATKEGTGFLTSISDRSGVVTRIYDAHGRVLSSLRTVRSETYVTTQAYDDDGNLTDRIYPDGYHTQFIHRNGFLTAIHDAGGMLISFSDFDTIGRPRQQNFRNGTRTSYVFAGEDPTWCAGAGEFLCGIDLDRGTGSPLLWSARRSLNAALQTEKSTDTLAGSFTYRYDQRGRLETAAGTARSYGYSFDENDNILPLDDRRAYSPDGSRLREFAGKPVEYDPSGRITRIGDSNGAVRLRYGLDRRPSELIAADGSVSQLAYDDDGSLTSVEHAGKLFVSIDGIATCDSSRRCSNKIVAGGLTLAEIRERGKKINFVHADMYGSVRMLTSETGSIVRKDSYGPFGEPSPDHAPSKAAPTILGYLGAPEHVSTGYSLLGSRVYSPRLRRFMQPDAVNPSLSLLRRNNPYSYGFNNPLAYRDPNGECPICIAIVIGALIGAAQAAINDQNILEGALIGGLIAVGFAAAAIGTEIGINAYVSAAIGQGLYSGMLASSRGQEFGPAFARGALTGLVSAGIGRGSMEVVPTPQTETFAGGIGRQAARDAIRGAASSVIVGAV
jgi:RHS repeat-associated protein